MTELDVGSLLSCADELAHDPEYHGKINAYDNLNKCVLDVKIDDDEWDFQESAISPKTAKVVDCFFKDLTDTFNADIASRYSVADFRKIYEDYIVIGYKKGCLKLSVDIPLFLKIALESYAQCSASSSLQWNKIFSGSIYALATMLQGSRAWYSLDPIFELMKKKEKYPAIMDSLKYSEKLLTFSRNTPDYLVKTLSSDAVVKINNEGWINAKGLRSIKYEPSRLDRYYVDADYAIKSFSTKSIRLPLGASDKSVSIEGLKGNPREKMADLARKAVKDEVTSMSSLQIDVFFKGVKYDHSKVVGFGDPRPGTIPAKELFSNPIYSLAVDSVSRKLSEKKDKQPDQAKLFDSDSSEKE